MERKTIQEMQDELNANVRGKLLRRWNKWPKRDAGCECGGLKRYSMSVCFRPSGQACLRRAKRRVIG